MKKVTIAVQMKEDIYERILVPLEEEREKLKPYHINQILNVTVNGEVDPRSLKQLALYWVCCQKVADNTDFPTSKDVDEYIKMKCHYVEWYYGLDGVQKARTKSISFESMDQPDFNLYMESSIDEMAKIINVTPQALVSSQFDL